jgi:hypothetical protein
MTFQNLDQLRTARNTALANSDYLLLPGAPLKQPVDIAMEAIKIYRQQLRDIPKQAEVIDVNEIELPELPTFFIITSSDTTPSE